MIMECNILVIDDEVDFLESVRRGLITDGYKNVFLFNQPARVTEFIKQHQVDLALIDITMPGLSGLEVLEQIKAHSPETECIMVTAVEEIEMAVQAMRLGAYDYLVKPLSREKLRIALERALERKQLLHLLDLQKGKGKERFHNPEAFAEIITVSRGFLKVMYEAELHARSDLPVLITGESGTGKELLSRAIHKASSRATKPFVPVNMASLTPTLFESEFFGHIRGAFTGADREREGYLEAAAGGTLFLDEIGDLASELQGKLLRVLQEKEFVKLGTNRQRKIEVRFIAATNVDLESMVKKGHFRQDLYYRLKVAWLHIPPLRDRPEDITPLANYFLKQFNPQSPPPKIQPEAIELLHHYHYPGNVRELRSIIQTACNLAQEGIISTRHLPTEVRKARISRVSKSETDTLQGCLSLAEVERAHILNVYRQTGNNKSQTARLLQIGLSTLHRKLKEYGVD